MRIREFCDGWIQFPQAFIILTVLLISKTQAEPPPESFTAEMNTSPSGLVSFSWDSRGGYGYRIETSAGLGAWEPLAFMFGTGGVISVPVAQMAPPGQQGGQNPPPGLTNTLRSGHFALRSFAGRNQTLVAWNQPEQAGLTQALIAGDFSNIVNLPLFFGKFEDTPNATDYRLSFTILAGEFDVSFEDYPVSALNPDEAARLAWFTDRLAAVKSAMEDAQANGDGILDHHEWAYTGSWRAVAV